MGDGVSTRNVKLFYWRFVEGGGRCVRLRDTGGVEKLVARASRLSPHYFAQI